MSYTRGDVLLKVEEVNKSYNKPVLNNVSFQINDITRPDIKQGQIVSLIGKSGSGKSTLFGIMAGLSAADTGKVLINKELTPVKEGDMGVVFQNSMIYPWRRVKKILSMTGRTQEEIDAIVNELDLKDHLEKFPSQLSGGQRQRVAIAEQVLIGNTFILLDEPFSGLDSISIDKVTRMLVNLSLRDELKTLIIVSHDLSNSLAISDSAYILSDKTGAGSTITGFIDLADMGLAWRNDIKRDSQFQDALQYIKTII
jgi:ABC-type nitrate/sulfonate/bicarbonate transport system ATPase subunit